MPDRDIYQDNPVFETNYFILRLVHEKDADDLYECYTDPVSMKYFNSDNCNGECRCQSLDEMKSWIQAWINQYKIKFFVRLSIVDKQLDKAIGTIEFFVKPEVSVSHGKIAILRIDLASQYETEDFIRDILNMVDRDINGSIEYDYIMTKAIPDARQRILALKNCGYQETGMKTMMPFDFYYMRAREVGI